MSKTKKWATKCRDILRIYRDDPLATPFLEPVVKYLQDPDKSQYLSIIKRPMDLGTLNNNLKNDVYKDQDEFFADFRLIFQNAIKYNEKTDPLIKGISEHFLKKIEKDRKAKFERTGCSGSQIALLFSHYLQILSEKPNARSQDIDEPIADVTTLGQAFVEPSLMILSEKLNKVSNEENYSKLCEIIGENKEGNSIELADLPKSTIDKLWNFVNNPQK